MKSKFQKKYGRLIIFICCLVLIAIAVVGTTVKNSKSKAESETDFSQTGNSSTEELSSGNNSTEEIHTEMTSEAVSSTTAKKEPELNSGNVKSVCTPLFRYYLSLSQDMHFAVGLDKNKNCMDILPDSWYEKTGMTEMGVQAVYKFKTVKNKSQLKKVYRKYLSQSILNKYSIDKNEMLVETDDALYWVEGGRGTYDFDANSVKLKSKDDNGYTVSVDAYIGDTYLKTSYFLVNDENGRFVISKELYDKQEKSLDFCNPNIKSIIV